MNEGLTALSTTVAQAIVAAYDFSTAERLVDVGGGQGQLLAAILRANPALRGTLFDLPTVVARAPRVLAEAGMCLNRVVPTNGPVSLVEAAIR